MCLPAIPAGVATAISIGTAVASAAAGMVTTMMQSKAQNKMAQQQAEAAQEAAANDYTLLDLQQTQANDKARIEKFERQRQAVRERGMINVAAGESGVGGNSLLRQVGDTYFQEEYDTDLIEQNRINALQMNQANRSAVMAQEKSRLNEARSNVVSPFTTALKMGSIGLEYGAKGFSTSTNMMSAWNKYKKGE